MHTGLECSKRKINKVILMVALILTSFNVMIHLISFADEVAPYRMESNLAAYEYLPYYHEDYKSSYLDYRILHPEIPWDQSIINVNLALGDAFYTNIQTVMNPEDIDCLINKTYQLRPAYIPSDLQRISRPYSNGTFYLRKEAKVAFEIMCQEASALGLKIKAVSAYRSYAYQKSLYERTIRLDDASTIEARDQQVARAGHSEHQLGLAVDVKGVDAWVENTAEYAWYSKNAHRFGYILRYPKGQDLQTGYRFEPWHLRYVGIDLAQKIYQSGMTYDAYHNMMTAKEPKALSVVLRVPIAEIHVNFQSYLFGGKTYIKLRDLEKGLSNTSLAFTIQWDEKTKRIHLSHTDPSTNEPYVQPPFLNEQHEQYAIQTKTITIVHESKQVNYNALIKDNQIYITQEDFLSLMD